MPTRSLDMDRTPPSLTTSPAPPQHTFFNSPPSPPETCCPSEGSTANDSHDSSSSPSRLPVDLPYEIPSPYSCIDAFSVAPVIPENDAFLQPLGVMSQSSWVPPNDLSSASSSSGPPTVLSAEYDSFATYDSVLSTPYASHHDTYASAPPPQHLSSTHPPSIMGRHSTQASALPPRPYEPSASRMKMDASPAYGSTFGGAQAQYSTPSAINAPFASSSSIFSSTGQSYYGGNTAPSWPKQEYDTSQPFGSPQGQMPDLTQDRRPLKATRSRRQPRKHTTKEEANFQCEVEGCGKFFSRSYNYKSHLETHDEKREYPFPCPVDGCSKKFVRKTDLQRHHQSVHMKERNHKCDYCGRLFARKDTLRRHMDDGCSKRFDIRTLDLRGEAYGNPNSMRLGTSAYAPFGQESATLPPINMNPMTPLMRSRDIDGGDDKPSSDRGWQR